MPCNRRGRPCRHHQASGFAEGGIWVWGFRGLGVSGFRVWGVGFWGFGGSGFRVWGVGFRGLGFRGLGV